MPEEKKPEIDSLQPSDTLQNTEVAKDAVITGADKTEHQTMFLDARAEGNQDSPSDLSLKVLNPDDPHYASIASNRFEIVDDSPEPPRPTKTTKHPIDNFERNIKPPALEARRPTFDLLLPIVRKEDDVPAEFYQKVVDAWNSLPLREQQLLKSAGVIVICKDILVGHDGTPARFFHATKNTPPTIHIGNKISGKFDYSRVSYGSPDVAGSLKHEAGHALFDILNISSRADFSKIYQQELSKIPKDSLGDTQLDNPSHVFGECYAIIRGRQSNRVQFIKENFPRTLKYVENEFEQ